MIVLDTHAWIWLAGSPEKLSAAARRSIEHARQLGVSAISPWEVAMLVAKGRVRFDRSVGIWIEQALALPKVELLPLLPEIAVRSVELGAGFPADPADRLIAATTLHSRGRLVTRDERLLSCAGLPTVW